jgi:hypothetical protein
LPFFYPGDLVGGQIHAILCYKHQLFCTDVHLVMTKNNHLPNSVSNIFFEKIISISLVQNGAKFVLLCEAATKNKVHNARIAIHAK